MAAGCSGFVFAFMVFTRMLVKNPTDLEESYRGWVKQIRVLEDILHCVYYFGMCFVVALDWRALEIWFDSSYTGTTATTSFNSVLICGIQVGVYFAMAFMVWIPPRKRLSDCLTMTFHHIVTVITVTSCVIAGYESACVMILLLHDVCDVPLQLMLLSRRFNCENLQVVFYCMTVAGFAVFRLVCFPIVVFVASSANYNSMTPYIVSLTAVLWFLHLYWFSKLAEQGILRLRGKPTYDPREHESEEEEEEEEAEGDEREQEGAVNHSSSIAERVSERRALKRQMAKKID